MTPGPEADRLRAIIETQTEIAVTRLNLDDVMQRVTDRALELTGAAAAVVEVADRDEMVYRAVAGTARPFLGLRLLQSSSLSGLCALRGELLRCDDAATDERVDEEASRRIGAMSIVCVPLSHDDETVGVLKVYAPDPHHFADEDVETLDLLSGTIAAHLSKAAAYEAAVGDSRTDFLTGLGNVRAYDEALAREASRASRYGSDLSLAMFDLDALGVVNEAHGNARGDELLKEVARILAGARTSDLAFRIGGDEFALLLPETEHEPARLVADRVVKQVQANEVIGGQVTVSAGVAPARSLDPRKVHADAEAALGAAKKLRS